MAKESKDEEKRRLQAESDEKERLAQEEAAKKRKADQAAADAQIEEFSRSVAEGGMKASEAAQMIAGKYRFMDPASLTPRIEKRAEALREKTAKLKTERQKEHQAAIAMAEADEEGKVLVNVPKPFRLTIIAGQEIRIAAGVQKVAKHVFDHPYSKANGMVPHIVK